MSDLDADIKMLVNKHFPTLHGQKEFIPGETFIPASGKMFDEQEVIALVKSSMNFDITEGATARTFEREMSRFVGVRHTSFCNSGSSANLLAFMALTSPKLGSKALKPGDEVITCAVGFPTTVAPIIQAGCIPVFVDVTIGNYNPTPHMIAEAITEKTRAIFIAHTLGNPFDVEAIKEIADQNNLFLIEDCADALGSKFHGKCVGTFGDISTTSFYPAHMMTTGEGGMVFTNNAMLNQIVRSLRDWGRECWCLPGKDNTCGKRFSHKDKGGLPDGYDHKYVYSHVGYNLKGTDIQAALGLEQLKKLPNFIEQRKKNWSYLFDGFVDSGLDKYFILPHHYQLSDPSPFGFLLTIKSEMGFTKGELVQYLEKSGIGTRNLFAGNITKQPGFEGLGRLATPVPKADIVMTNTFWIGCHPSITIPMLDYVIETFSKFIGAR